MKLCVITFLTLDGVMQAPGGPEEDKSENFPYGGWQAPYGDEEFGKIITDMFTRVDGFLLGRKTYDIFASYWPNHETEGDPVSTSLNSLPKYVASNTLDKADWNNSTVIEGDIVSAVQELKKQDGRELQVWGSSKLIQSLMQNSLVDEYHLFTYPLTLGTGKRLFEGAVPRALELAESKISPSGIIYGKYLPVGEPTYGTVGE